MNYHHLMLGDEQYVKAENPYTNFHPVQHPEFPFDKSRKQWAEFDKANPPIRYFGPAFEGVKSDSELDFIEQVLSGIEWEDITEKQATMFPVSIAQLKREEPKVWRKLARLKSQKQIISEAMEADEKDGLYEAQMEQADIEDISHLSADNPNMPHLCEILNKELEQPVQRPESYTSPIIEQFMSEHNPNGERIEREMIEMAGKEQPVQQEKIEPISEEDSKAMIYSYADKSFTKDWEEQPVQQEEKAIYNFLYCAYIAGYANPQLKPETLTPFFNEWYNRNKSQILSYVQPSTPIASEGEESICSINCKCQSGEDCDGESALNLIDLIDQQNMIAEIVEFVKDNLNTREEEIINIIGDKYRLTKIEK